MNTPQGGSAPSAQGGIGIWLVMVVIGLTGVVWALVDVINRGVGDVPGSTWLCGVLGLVLAAFALYREFGGEPLITFDDENIAEEYEQQKRDSARERGETGDDAR
ncbi:hypothetical protein [Gordonia sp. NPDC003950]